MRVLGLARRGNYFDVIEGTVPAGAVKVRLPKLDRFKALDQLRLAQTQLYAMGKEPRWPESIRGDMLAAQSCLAQLWPLLSELEALVQSDAENVGEVVDTIVKLQAQLAPLYAKAMGDAQ